MELATGQAEIRVLTADATHLFWATATGQIKSLAKDGSDDGPRVLAVSAENIEAVAVTAERVFWVTSMAVMRVTR